MKKILGIILSGLLILTIATPVLAKHKKGDNRPSSTPKPRSVQGQVRGENTQSQQQIRKATIFGKIVSLDAGNDSFVIQAGKFGQLTINVAGNTKLVNRGEKEITFTDLVVGQRVRVKGSFDFKEHKFVEITQVKNFTLSQH